MYKNQLISKKGKTYKYVSLSQTFTGWNVSTYTITGKKIKILDSRSTTRLSLAKKEFTRQKNKY